MRQIFSNIYAFLRFAPLVIFLLVATGGAFAALIGGLAGWVDVAEFGKLAAGGGSLAFFTWLLLPALIQAI